jgi:glycerol-3-phosphate acyltransferase PlsX|tara:strand:- start:489 stop:1523 length:1035 start_codon:yes stop_codon:yes gene_type:complete
VTKIFTLSVDTLGSETELNDILKGLNQSLLRNLNYKFQLYGPEEIIKKKIEKYKRLIKVTEIIDCDSYITMEDKPSDILKSKKTSSMYLAIKSVTEKLSDAILSFGNTGALMSLSLLNIKTLKGIKRPAIASIWPNMKGESVVLDLGANTKLDSRYLIDNSILGASLASILFKIDNPSIGLLNVGKEDNKGKDEIKLASDQLRDLSQNFSVNYYGYIEGNDISTGSTNVVVTDGFTGNISLKTAEGTAKLFQSHLEDAFKSSILSKIGYFLSSLAMKSVRDRLDPRVHNCGILMGLNSLAVKCHGHSEYRGVSYAADIIYSLLDNNVNKKISDYVSEMHSKLKN